MEKELHCKIIQEYQSSLGNVNIEYAVYDGEKVVATGISSSLDWVMNDAGGYHTKETFDKLYPNGWKVIFNF